MIKKISEQASSSVVTNLSELLISLSSTIICRIAFGRRYEDEGTEKSKFHDMLNEFQALLATFFVSDYIPFTGWIDKLTGLNARLDKNFKEMDQFYQDVIDEHMDPNRQKPEEEDIVDVLLRLKKQDTLSIDLTTNHIKGILMECCLILSSPLIFLIVELLFDVQETFSLGRWVTFLISYSPRSFLINSHLIFITGHACSCNRYHCSYSSLGYDCLN